jgi:hypothetical protein
VLAVHETASKKSLTSPPREVRIPSTLLALTACHQLSAS